MSTAVPPATSRVGNNGAKGKGGENKVRTATTHSSIPGTWGPMRHGEPSQNCCWRISAELGQVGELCVR